jgi:cellulose synthase/poly-beta-1,6-N-acetylglucosamine synthase-like glycosyltransferase
MPTKYTEKNVGIIVNVYNAKNTIIPFMESLKKQSYQDFQITIVDDGSIDSTLQHIQKYQNMFDMHIYRCEHKGLRIARKFGVDQTHTKYLIILDSDLILEQTTLQELINSLHDKNVGAVGGVLKTKDEGTIASSYGLLREWIYSLRTQGTETDWISGGFFATKKHVIDQVGGFTSSTTSGDLDISWKIKEQGYKLLLNKNAIAFHDNPNTFKGIWNRENKIGHREYYLAKKHVKQAKQIRRLLRFYPLFLPLFIIFFLFLYWPLVVLLILLSYISILFVVKGSLIIRSCAWIIFNIMNFAYTLGYLSELLSRKK